MSQPIDRTFPVPVEGIGTFTFRRRQMRDQIRIQAEATRLLGGPCDDPEQRDIAFMSATLITLTVDAPPGESFDELDPLDKETSAKLWRIFGALRVAEDRFRGGAKPQRA